MIVVLGGGICQRATDGKSVAGKFTAGKLLNGASTAVTLWDEICGAGPQVESANGGVASLLSKMEVGPDEFEVQIVAARLMSLLVFLRKGRKKICTLVAIPCIGTAEPYVGKAIYRFRRLWVGNKRWSVTGAQQAVSESLDATLR